MKLASLRSSARYLALVLPAFALFTAVHSGCTNRASGVYNSYGYNRTAATEDSSENAGCTTVTHYYGSYTTCDDDDDGYYGR